MPDNLVHGELVEMSLTIIGADHAEYSASIRFWTERLLVRPTIVKNGQAYLETTGRTSERRRGHACARCYPHRWRLVNHLRRAERRNLLGLCSGLAINSFGYLAELRCAATDEPIREYRADRELRFVPRIGGS